MQASKSAIGAAFGASGPLTKCHHWWLVSSLVVGVFTGGWGLHWWLVSSLVVGVFHGCWGLPWLLGSSHIYIYIYIYIYINNNV